MDPDVNLVEENRAKAYFSPLARRKLLHTTAAAILFVLVVAQQHMAFLALLLVIPFTFWLTWSAYVLVARPYFRKAQALAVLIWLVAIAATAWIHHLRHMAARSDAQTVVQSLRNRIIQQKRCPQDINSLSADRSAVPLNLRAILAYECINNHPRFAYRVTFTILDTYEYDFATHRWRYVSWSERADYALPERR